MRTTMEAKERERLSHRLCPTSLEILLPQYWKILRRLIRRSRRLHTPPLLQIKGNVVFHPFPRTTGTGLFCALSAICSFQLMLKAIGRLGWNGSE